VHSVLTPGANESSAHVVAKLLSSPAGVDNGIVQSFADSMQSVYTLKSKMVDDLVEQLINPLQKFLRDDAKQMKETGRNFDKMMEKFDTAFTRYNGLSKGKELSALREDDLQLFEIKKGYVRSSLDYTFKIS
jgi:hypothetical protein